MQNLYAEVLIFCRSFELWTRTINENSLPFSWNRCSMMQRKNFEVIGRNHLHIELLLLIHYMIHLLLVCTTRNLSFYVLEIFVLWNSTNVIPRSRELDDAGALHPFNSSRHNQFQNWKHQTQVDGLHEEEKKYFLLLDLLFSLLHQLKDQRKMILQLTISPFKMNWHQSRMPFLLPLFLLSKPHLPLLSLRQKKKFILPIQKNLNWIQSKLNHNQRRYSTSSLHR